MIISPAVCDDIVCELQNLGFQDIICLNDIFEWSPYTPVKDRKKDFQYAHPFGHYDSPYADLAFVRKNKNQIYNVNKKMNINFDIEGQINLLKQISGIPLLNWNKNEPSNSLRYYYDNGWFDFSCAVALYGIIMLKKPKHIIEIGSGFSTSLMLDTNE